MGFYAGAGCLVKRINFLVGVALAVVVLLCVLGEPDVEGAGQFERRHGSAWCSASCRRGQRAGSITQSGNEIVYIEEGSVTFEAQGKPAVTLKPGEAFTTVAAEVHNVKNASSSAPAKALAFYVAKKGSRLEDLSVPAK